MFVSDIGSPRASAGAKKPLITWSRAGVRRLVEDDSDRIIRGLLLILIVSVGVRVEDDAGLGEEDTRGVRKTYNCLSVKDQ